jgi:asparagine synthase (glutamine-hydrolysing)
VSGQRRLLNALVQQGPEALCDLDGEYLVLLWNAKSRMLQAITDRFGSVPAFHGTASSGSAIATTARAVAAAPGMDATADAEAIREAATFGGFRLGARTLIRSVSLQTPATGLTVTSTRVASRRYWHWPSATPDQRASDMGAVLDELQALWQDAIARRLEGVARPGLHLSGGLDSRAILAELVNRGVRPHTVTFGVAGSDEVRFAAQAAAAAEVPWTHFPSYAGGDDWLSRRERWVYHTDGMIDLADLRHLDSLPVQAATMDAHLSGYIGDLVLGARYNSIATVEEAMQALPYYGGILGFSLPEARQRIAACMTSLGDAAPRFLIYEHKCPQSTNRWISAWRPWLSVRKPFTSYRLFDLCQGRGLPLIVHRALREHWLHRFYPRLFRQIPEARTAAPILSSAPRRQMIRVTRHAARRLRGLLHAADPDRARSRDATPDAIIWRRRDIRPRLEGAILRERAVSSGIFGRERLRQVVQAYFDRQAAPTQVIAALFVFETFHTQLADHLANARHAGDVSALTPAAALVELRDSRESP